MPHEWDSPEYVRQWIEDGDKADPQRAEQITALVGLVRCSAEEPIEVLDLGAGYGIVTREVLTTYPNAQVVCLDGSEEMLKHGEARLADWGDQLCFIVANFDSPDWLATLPADRQFDAVVSSRAIHHTVDDRKQALYAEIFQLLKPGGCFANHDLVRKPGDSVRDSDNPFGTVEDQIVWLENIGFVDVECFWQTEGRALFGGYKPGLT
jgi:ubiquinone/menaquinone biosynthesis C-methylase UbiE